ncbi:MAG: hypothetical protein KAI47_16695 [Deltaproteobacteria bacterium]|nr:hypothetical protein [Deltaproteobacteria bacterium]
MGRHEILGALLTLSFGACATSATSIPRNTTPTKSKATLAPIASSPARPLSRTPSALQTRADTSRVALLIKLADGREAIDRQKFQLFQKRGAQRFIQDVQVRPTFARGRFFGWRVLAYQGPGKLLPGDVVRRVNGRPIERPMQVMTVWAQMAQRTNLVVEVFRNGRTLVLRLPIVDHP